MLYECCSLGRARARARARLRGRPCVESKSWTWLEVVLTRQMKIYIYTVDDVEESSFSLYPVYAITAVYLNHTRRFISYFPLTKRSLILRLTNH